MLPLTHNPVAANNGPCSLLTIKCSASALCTGTSSRGFHKRRDFIFYGILMTKQDPFLNDCKTLLFCKTSLSVYKWAIQSLRLSRDSKWSGKLTRMLSKLQ